jgi:O-succinylbenzoic acid--CoA ligase
MTEMASQVTTTAPRASPAELSTSGRILPHRELRISQGGEILVRGDTLFLGYLGPDGTDPARDAEGWFHTGYLGTVGADGLLRVAGRRDNLFISGGENIQPEEIEHVLGEHPQIDEAIVVPVPDREWGQRPVAFIRGATKPPPAAEIEVWLGERLPRYMVPVAFLPWPTAETSAQMKPDRIALAGTVRELPDASS